MTTSLKERPGVAEREITVRPPATPKRPRRLVRWIEYSAVALVVAAASIAAVIALTGDDDGAVPFDEAQSLLIMGDRHTADFEVAPRWVGESDMTLAEFEAVFDGFGTLYEAQSPLSIGERHEPGFEVSMRMVFESDGTLEEFEASR